MVSPTSSVRVSDPIQVACESDPELFTLLRPLQPGDWLAEHWEPGQTYEEFVNTAARRPDNTHTIIYLQPLEPFIQDQSPPLPLLQEFVQAYIGLSVNVLPVLTETSQLFPTRNNPHTGTHQVLTTAILKVLQQHRPPDAFGVIAITMQDLYPASDWNFVFGQALVEQGIGVFSFARYDPAFYGIPRDEGYRTVLLRRCCKVVIHEIGHVFGLAHCPWYACSMNGSNHLQEADSRPMHLCPICLRKLHYTLGFDVVMRYRRLLQFYLHVHFGDEALWVQKRLKKLLPSRTT